MVAITSYPCLLVDWGNARPNGKGCNKLSGVIVLRRVKDLPHVASFDQSALIHHRDVIGDALATVRVVGDYRSTAEVARGGVDGRFTSSRVGRVAAACS